MKQIRIKYLPKLNEANIEDAGSILEDEQVSQGLVDQLNWAPQYAYRPITVFYIARSSDALFIKFNVHGSMLKAIYSEDQSPVYKDSCVEFFCRVPGSEYYFNFEFNCIGVCRAATRKSRNEAVRPLSSEKLMLVKRYSSLGTRVFKEMEGMFEWDLSLKIPFELIGLNPEALPEYLLGNFNKCADDTDSPHYVTWSPIQSEKPDFHHPECFGKLLFE